MNFWMALMNFAVAGIGVAAALSNASSALAPWNAASAALCFGMGLWWCFKEIADALRGRR